MIKIEPIEIEKEALELKRKHERRRQWAKEKRMYEKIVKTIKMRSNTTKREFEEANYHD